MKRKRMIFNIIMFAIITCVLIAIIGVLVSRRLTTAKYKEYISGAKDDVKIALIADIHGREYGTDNSKLLDLVAQQSPDIIAVAGDVINRNANEKEIDRMCALLSRLTSIAPTYFSIGNHETGYMSKHGTTVLEEVQSTGVTVLECEYRDLTVNGTTFRLGGMSELAYYGGDGKYDPKAEPFLIEYCDTELPKVMLSHRPEAFYFKYAYRDWDVDLILSGHTHGGLVRLPVVGGLFAPIQGLFPDVYYGEYELDDTKMIITSGLSGYGRIPRVFNPPEICVVTLTAKG